DTLLAKLCLYYCLTGANSFTLGGSSLAIRALPCVDLGFSGNCCHLLILCHPVYFFEAGNTCDTLHQRRGSQTVESLGTNHFIDHYRVAFLHDDPGDLRCNAHNLVDTYASFVATLAFGATDGLHYSRGLQLFLRKARMKQRFVRKVRRNCTVPAQFARQPLRND